MEDKSQEESEIIQGTLQKIWNSHSRSYFLEADFRRPIFSPQESTV